jgi:glutathione S-transferase
MTETLQEDEIKLYGYVTSPFVMKVAAFLKYKRLNYIHVHVRPLSNEQIQFTGQTQVPVLEIYGEWRNDSTQLGVWLDELYPEPPLLGRNANDRQKILSIDQWVSNVMIRSQFREAVDWTNSYHSIRNGWRLARMVNFGTPIPWTWQLFWPFGVKRAPFIVDMVNQLDRSEPIGDMQKRILDELELHLAAGSYLSGGSEPSLADLSAYPVIMSGWLTGMRGGFSWRNRPTIMAWLQRVQSHLPDNPLPVDDRFLVLPLPF